MAEAYGAHLSGDSVGQTEREARRAAFEDRVRAERDRLRGLAWRFGIPADELDDAVQEVYTRAWAALPGFRGDADMATWLTRIALRVYTSRRRTWLRRLRHWVRDPAVMNDAPAAAGLSPEAAEAYRIAVACVARLPVKLRQAFVLRYLEEMSCAETAALLGIPEATVRTRIYHARRKLQAMMTEYER